MALKGLRVLDLSRILAGPWCTMLLGDLGASIIKIENPIGGDDTRSWGPPFLPLHSSSNDIDSTISSYFASVNRNKKSVAINLKRKRGRDICRTLATEWADVVVENFKVGTMEEIGLGYESLRDANPGLIYCSITGFGTTGPYKRKLGYDMIASGMYGLMSITGTEQGGPIRVGVAITDVLTGTLAQAGILAALHSRNTTGGGVGQRVDASLMETQLASLVNIAASSLNSPNTPPPKRWGTAHESVVPYQAFRCQCGGHVVMGAGNDDQFRELCHVLGHEGLAEDDRFASNSKRVANRRILIPVLERILESKTREEWSTILEDRKFPFGPIRTVPESFACEQSIHRNMVMEVDHSVAGRILLPGHPVKYSHSSVSGDKNGEILPPPMLGEHTHEILEEILNFSTNEIKRLEEDGVVRSWSQKKVKYNMI